MGDMRADNDGNGARLPWLEPVPEEEEGDGPPLTKLIGAVVIGLVVLGLIVGGLFWLGTRGPGREGTLIAAPEGDYKVRPADPGGMRVEGEGDTAFAASEGEEPEGRLDVGAVPEAPVTQTPPPPDRAARTQPEEAPLPESSRPEPEPAEPAAPGATVQLGAFSSQAAANGAWKALSERFAYLAPLSHSVVPVQSGGRTLYRLRAAGPGAADICRRLKVAGESCVVIG